MKSPVVHEETLVEADLDKVGNEDVVEEEGARGCEQMSSFVVDNGATLLFATMSREAL